MQLMKKFIPSIDNQSKIKQVHSIIVAPIFGHRPVEDNDLRNLLANPPNLSLLKQKVAQAFNPKKEKPERGEVVGVLQLINKTDYRITEYDLVSFQQ